jgi:glycosyltransferase involved in cell wall biosynthesis
MVQKAIDTALAQTVPCEVIISDHGSTDGSKNVIGSYGNRVNYLRRDKDRGPLFAWLDGVVNATTPYVHITYDDDWIDPTFIEKTLSLMDGECAFVFTDVVGHFDDGTTRREQRDLFATGSHPREYLERYLLDAPLTISPGCALFRRQEVINALVIGDLPFAKYGYRGAGPDMLMFLQPLLRYRRFGFVNEALAHFSAHSGSITATACREPEEMQRLMGAYNDVKEYYLRLKWMQEGHVGAILFKIWRRFDARRREGIAKKMAKSKELFQ